jgi:V/A-type H+-transporting ATPase subunit D
MRRRDIPCTKSNLLRLREQFAFVKAGHELLDQKREVLLEELTQTFREAQRLRRELTEALATLYAMLRDGLLADGRAALEAEAFTLPNVLPFSLRERSIMGVTIPLLTLAAALPATAHVAPGTASPAAAWVRRQVRTLLPALLRQAEIEVSCRRLAAELQKTQRKVNALEHIFLPEYRDTIQFIEATLEEKEREALFQLKRLEGARRPHSVTTGPEPPSTAAGTAQEES